MKRVNSVMSIKLNAISAPMTMSWAAADIADTFGVKRKGDPEIRNCHQQANHEAGQLRSGSDMQRLPTDNTGDDEHDGRQSQYAYGCNRPAEKGETTQSPLKAEQFFEHALLLQASRSSLA
jgi:hypothetical protein